MKIIITGISRGLGKELFDLISNETVDVIAVSRSFCDYQIELANNKSSIKLLKLDLSNTSEVKDALSDMQDEDVLFINNAATIEPISNVGEMQSEDIIKALNLNFVSPALLINNLAKNKLSVLNISTGATHQPIDKWSLYCSSKAGLEMFLNVLKLQLSDESVVNIDPGVMDTGMQEKIRNSDFENADYFKSLQSNNLLKSPKDVAIDIFNKYIKEKINNEK